MRVLIIALCLIFSSCSSAYHLKKAYEKDPSLLKIDTLYIPTISIDTLYKLDTVEIKSDLDSILNNIDSIGDCPKEEIIREVTKYITTNLITDTLTYDSYLNTDSVDLHLKLRVWQEKGEIKFNSSLIDSKVKTKAPINIIKKDSWFSKREEIVGIILFMFLIVLLLIRK